MPTAVIRNNINNYIAFCRLTVAFIKKHKPIYSMYLSLVNAVNDILTTKQRLDGARRKVNYYMYRFEQMETIMSKNAASNYLTDGKNINHIR